MGTVHPPGDPDGAVARQLDGLLETCWLPARCALGVCEVGSPTELPLALEQCIQRLPPTDLWRAYSDGVRVWLVTARAVQAASRDPAAIALELHFFENDGSACAAGIWQRSPEKHWTLNAVLDWPAAPRRPRPESWGSRRMRRAGTEA